jgi:hypothetical protein
MRNMLKLSDLADETDVLAALFARADKLADRRAPAQQKPASEQIIKRARH